MTTTDPENKPDILPLLKSKLKPAAIDNSPGLKNLSLGCWVYDELLQQLKTHGWVRFAVGCKAALYGRPEEPWCIKIMGMGVGDYPAYFCERGYYLLHEREMLEDFEKAGFTFQPQVMPAEDTVEYLQAKCGLSRFQAERRTYNHDLLVLEYIPGVPLAAQTGQPMQYAVDFSIRGRETLARMLAALYGLRESLAEANRRRLLHNDPVPPNILLCLDNKRDLQARLVDFELAQNLYKHSPDYVTDTVRELYRERNVPRNAQTNRHVKNLDQHLLDEVIHILNHLPANPDAAFLGSISFPLPFSDTGENTTTR
ncbi:serine/threonine protein kinase [candidate division FCPU426 bacterium]|nr:serine/threonine protein kinase [candidate division FCPU426 bacterium]